MSADQIPLSIATVSIGCDASHTLPKKLSAIASAGFTGIELGFPDLVSFAGEHLRHEVASDAYDDLVAAAKVVKAMCEAKKLEIMLLQPFTNFEGWKEGTKEREDVFTKLHGWIEVSSQVWTDPLWSSGVSWEGAGICGNLIVLSIVFKARDRGTEYTRVDLLIDCFLGHEGCWL